MKVERSGEVMDGAWATRQFDYGASTDNARRIFTGRLGRIEILYQRDKAFALFAESDCPGSNREFLRRLLRLT